MAQKSEQDLTFESLNTARKGALRIPDYQIDSDRYVIFSDIHKGDREKGSDDFQRNEMVYCFALRYYLDHDYHLILNGDVEEGWEADYPSIIQAYESTAFAMERHFVTEGNGRYIRIYGNHDLDWANPDQVKQHLVRVLGPVRVYPAVSLGDRIFIVHGHQGDRHSDQGARLSRLVVRHIWRPLQRTFGLMSNRAAENNLIRRNRDKYLYEWAKANRLLLIAGHTHRAMFRSFSKTYQLKLIRDELLEQLKPTNDPYLRFLIPAAVERINKIIQASTEELEEDKEISRIADNPLPCYFNDGCCVHTNGITGIEIDRGEIRLVKWEVSDTYCVEGGEVRRRTGLFANIERKIYQSDDLAQILSQI
ncbi:MAG: metallophosphoesterase [Anaerolineae bacterium]